MLGKDIYKVWAPIGAKWVQWVRPVPFIGINNKLKVYDVSDFSIPKITYITNYREDTAFIIDLQGDKSIKEGLALARIGFRPIPIYNGNDAQKNSIATVDNNIIKLGLIKGAKELREITLKPDASPAFLLDSNRTNQFKMNFSVFDNSWDIYGQDLPSAEYLLKNNIKRMIVRSDKLQNDLNKILYKFAEKGIIIYFTNGYEEPKCVRLKKPKLDKNDF